MNIQKSYSFCYGHRVWNQELSGGRRCLCRYTHGHSGKVDINLSGSKHEKLRGMVVDFNELKFIKEFLDEVVDHHFLIDLDDPLLIVWLRDLNVGLDDLLPIRNGDAVYFLIPHHFGPHKDVANNVMNEFRESLVIVPFVPTAENLACWLLDWVKFQLKSKNYGVPNTASIHSIKWWETDNSFAEVFGDE